MPLSPLSLPLAETAGRVGIDVWVLSLPRYIMLVFLSLGLRLGNGLGLRFRHENFFGKFPLAKSLVDMPLERLASNKNNVWFEVSILFFLLSNPSTNSDLFSFFSKLERNGWTNLCKKSLMKTCMKHLDAAIVPRWNSHNNPRSTKSIRLISTQCEYSATSCAYTPLLYVAFLSFKKVR
jgi:hypothetical protein